MNFSNRICNRIARHRKKFSACDVCNQDCHKMESSLPCTSDYFEQYCRNLFSFCISFLKKTRQAGSIGSQHAPLHFVPLSCGVKNVPPNPCVMQDNLQGEQSAETKSQA